MLLSRTSHYALQALIHLAQHEVDWPIPGPQIAQETGIPAKYLSAILGTLVRTGVLKASPGRSGGFRVARSPTRVSLLDVLTPFEADLFAPHPTCPFGNPVCGDKDPCAGHSGWKIVLDTYQDFLKNTSVKDVASKQRTIRRKRKRKTAKPR